MGGLAALNRLDVILLAGPLMAVVLVGRPRALVGLLPLAGWLLLAAWYYGTPFPNTMYAKVGAFSTGEALRHGLSYLADWVLTEPLHAAVAAIGVTLGFQEGRSRSWPQPLQREQVMLLACCVGVGLYVLYVVVIGGDFMRGRMFTAPFLVSVMVVGMVLAIRGPALTPQAAAVALALSVASLFVNNTTLYDARIGDSGVGSERAIYHVGSG